MLGQGFACGVDGPHLRVQCLHEHGSEVRIEVQEHSELAESHILIAVLVIR